MRRHFKKNLILIPTVIILGVFGFGVRGAFNEQINYQGKLTNTAGTVVSDGDTCMKFRLMSASSGGTELWSETWTGATQKITTTSGLFSVLLGENTSLSYVNFNQASIYLEFQYDPGCDDIY